MGTNLKNGVKPSGGVRRVWPVIIKARVIISGREFEEWVQAFPTPCGGFIVVVQLVHGWKSYYIEDFNQVSEAVRQAIIDHRLLNCEGGIEECLKGTEAIRVVITEVGNTWVGHRNMVREGLENELPPLNDLTPPIEVSGE